MTEGASSALRDRIDAIEEAYEYMLAYAAQGKEDDIEPGGQLRELMTAALAALDGLADAAHAEAGGDAEPLRDWLEILADDARKTAAAFGLTLSRPRISSQLIDNINASIHVRALLTDIFIIDEALKTPRDLG